MAEKDLDLSLRASLVGGAIRTTFEDGEIVKQYVAPKDFYLKPEPPAPGPNEVLHPIYWKYD